MMSWLLCTSVIALACLSGTLGALIQTQSLSLPSDAAQQRDAVKNIFRTSWDAYKKYAFPLDDLDTLSLKGEDSRNGWGATAVDALTTLYIINEQTEFEEMVDFASKIDFTKLHSADTASVFESTIRYLGGLLSAYELSGKQYPALVKQAQTLADKLTVAWGKGSPIPYGHVNINTSTPTIATSNIAEAGTLALEWSRLALYTNNDNYRALAEDAMRRIANNPAPLPGLPAQSINPTNGDPVGAYVTWGGASDSYMEYLIKYPRLTNTDDNFFTNQWLAAVDSSIKHLLQRSPVGNWTYLAERDDQGNLHHVSSHLACFHAGNWIMGGRMTNNDTIFQLGLELNDACYNTYASTATGIGPDSFYYSDAINWKPSDGEVAFYNRHGFYTSRGGAYYATRPEVMESNCYAYRATGDPKYYDRAVEVTRNFATFLLTPNGTYSGIVDVHSSHSDHFDRLESFWFAETLKYLYLTFDDPEHISFDKYVFNTEAHPFIAPEPKVVYGDGPVKVPATNSAQQRRHFPLRNLRADSGKC